MLIIPPTRGQYREHLRDEFAAFPFPKLSHWFNNARPSTLEIGCGEGHWVMEQAQRDPDRNFVAMDNNLDRMAVGLHLASGLTGSKPGADQPAGNLRFVLGDANFFLFAVPHQYNDVVLNFPDPWSSKLSSWRRLLSPAFVQLIHQRLAVNGRLTVVTDNRSYVDWALRSVGAADCAFEGLPGSGFIPLPTNYGYSAFRDQWEKDGRACHYMEWRKTAQTTEACMAANRAFDFGRAKLPSLEPAPTSKL
jgi:tRNA (guanine-N7-)-methyltransferase